ncbi:hypothetical protein [Microcoleus sp.]|uniref:hypothetical protein n=1 Tax=Microcoleus sp. TaxID=44472 RepID=UPI003526AC3B
MNYAARLSDIRLALNRATIRLSSWSKPHAEVRREPRLPNVRMESYRLPLSKLNKKSNKEYEKIGNIVAVIPALTVA